MSRHANWKCLASGEMQQRCSRRQNTSTLDLYAEILSSWLGRESKRNCKRRSNLKQARGDLVALGFDGPYDRVAAIACERR